MRSEELAILIRTHAVELAGRFGGTVFHLDHDYMGVWRMHIGTSDRGAALLAAGATTQHDDAIPAERIALEVGPVEVYTYVRGEP